MLASIPSLSEIQEFGEASLNQLLVKQIEETLATENELEKLVKQRDLAKEKTKQIDGLRKSELEEISVDTVVDLVYNVKTLEQEIQKTAESIEKLKTADPGEEAKEFFANLESLKADLAQVQKERRVKEIVYRQITTNTYTNPLSVVLGEKAYATCEVFKEMHAKHKKK